MTSGSTSPGHRYDTSRYSPQPAEGYNQAPFYPHPGMYGAAQVGYPPSQYVEYPPRIPTTQQFSTSKALSYGWRKFKTNRGTWLRATTIVWGVVGALNMLGADSHSAAVMSVLRVVGVIVWVLFADAMVVAALSEVDGVRPTLTDFKRVEYLGQFVVTSILLVLAMTIATMLLVIPGLIIAILLQWSALFVVDHGQTPVTAIRSSINAVRTNIAGALTLLAALVVINFFGALLCGLGLLVTGPISVIASAWAYRTTIGGVVSP